MQSLTSLSEKEIQAGEFCLVQPEGSPEYYRALVLSLNQESKIAHVIFIDYGDEDDVSYDKVSSFHGIYEISNGTFSSLKYCV